MNFDQLKSKLENFCAYQERCHSEVVTKLKNLGATSDEINLIIVHLIENNYLNEERFARSFARGKHRIKNWGRIRIENELKLRGISAYNIKKALEEIEEEPYEDNFNAIAQKTYESIKESNYLKKKKKFFDTLYRKGFEASMIFNFWDKLND